jgi:hypothetical protein
MSKDFKDLMGKFKELEVASDFALKKETLATVVEIAREQGMNEEEFSEAMNYIYDYFLGKKYSKAKSLAVLYALLLFITIDLLKEEGVLPKD